MKTLIYSQEDLNLMTSLEIQEKDEEIENLQQELQRKDNIINELEEKLISVCETCYEDKETARIKKWIDKIKELDSK